MRFLDIKSVSDFSLETIQRFVLNIREKEVFILIIKIILSYPSIDRII